jgi:hypothetical protein
VPALLSVARVAQMLDCSPRTVRRRIAEGALPAVIERERVMVRGDELRAYVDGLERPGATSPRRRARNAGGRFDFLRERADLSSETQTKSAPATLTTPRGMAHRREVP